MLGKALKGGTMADKPNEGFIKSELWNTASFYFAYAVLLGLILFLDFQIPLGVAVDMLYILVVLLSFWSNNVRVTILVAIVSSVLTVGAFFCQPFVAEMWKVIFNRLSAIFAIWVTALLIMMRNKAEEALKESEQRFRSMFFTDELTGLYNRRGFITLAEQQLKVAERAKKDMLLYFVDLDRMKEINDTLGHQEGDNALVEVAAVLKEAFRESDIVGRIGGDEFAVLAIDTIDETRDVLIQRLYNILDIRNRHEGRNYQISLSVGIAHYNNETPLTLDKLMAQADELMYEEKRKKRE